VDGWGFCRIAIFPKLFDPEEFRGNEQRRMGTGTTTIYFEKTADRKVDFSIEKLI
jgi:hypothetical protein